MFSFFVYIYCCQKQVWVSGPAATGGSLHRVRRIITCLICYKMGQVHVLHDGKEITSYQVNQVKSLPGFNICCSSDKELLVVLFVTQFSSSLSTVVQSVLVIR